jgi:pimeloyl-ACP methyl ester carboxylesterase
VSTPVAVLAAERDAIFPVHEEVALAAAYGVPLQLLEGAGHDAMVDIGWPAVSEAIDRFVGSRS